VPLRNALLGIGRRWSVTQIYAVVVYTIRT
jgi:hypothetical protein